MLFIYTLYFLIICTIKSMNLEILHSCCTVPYKMHLGLRFEDKFYHKAQPINVLTTYTTHILLPFIVCRNRQLDKLRQKYLQI